VKFGLPVKRTDRHQQSLLEEDDNNGLLTSDKLLPFRGVGQKDPEAEPDVEAMSEAT